MAITDTSGNADCTQTWSENGTAQGTYWIEYGATDDPGPSTSPMSTPATFPTPVMPAHNTNPSIPPAYLSGSNSNGLQDLSIADGSIVTLPGGTYDLNSLSVSNGSTLTFSGPVTLNIATNVNINAAAIVPSSTPTATAACTVTNRCRWRFISCSNLGIVIPFKKPRT